MLSRTAVVAAACCAIVVVSVPRTARAQVQMVGPAIGPPRVTWLATPGVPGDSNGASGDSRVPAFVLDPIRLALLGTAVPHSGNVAGGCGDSIESTGIVTAGASGFALQHAAAIQLVPRLTLSGFARGGCAIDAAMGGALVYATPLAKNIFLVGSAGILHLPHAGPGGASITRADIRADVVFARPGGRSYAVGIGTRGISFGGTL
jgi:hypothetical protein